MLDPQAQARVRQAIRDAEAQTQIEFVTVITRQSDGYYFIPTLWAALIALLLPLALLLSPYWLEVFDIVVAQLAVFSALTALFRWSPVMYRIVPRKVLQHRARNMARRQFLDQGVHRTREGTGVLFFVSEAEHYVEIIADSGIDQRVSQTTWQQIVDDFTASVKRGDIEAGFIQAVQVVAKLGAEVAPATRQENELSDHLVVIG